MMNDTCLMFVFVFLVSTLNVQSSKDAEGGTKRTPKKHKHPASSNESSGPAARGNNGEDEEDGEELPAKRRKKVAQQHTLKKVC